MYEYPENKILKFQPRELLIIQSPVRNCQLSFRRIVILLQKICENEYKINDENN